MPGEFNLYNFQPPQQPALPVGGAGFGPSLEIYGGGPSVGGVFPPMGGTGLPPTSEPVFNWNRLGTQFTQLPSGNSSGAGLAPSSLGGRLPAPGSYPVPGGQPDWRGNATASTGTATGPYPTPGGGGGLLGMLGRLFNQGNPTNAQMGGGTPFPGITGNLSARPAFDVASWLAGPENQALRAQSADSISLMNQQAKGGTPNRFFTPDVRGLIGEDSYNLPAAQGGGWGNNRVIQRGSGNLADPANVARLQGGGR